MKTEIAIVGGGLSGLALADGLHQAGVDFQLFEARPRLGGRIAALATPAGAVDLGPSWFWPGQPRIARLIEDLGLRAFPQHADGDICFEDERGIVHRGMGFASMEGSFRLEGGMESIIRGLGARLPQERLHLSSGVTEIAQDGRLLIDGDRWCEARQVVLALPPRIAATLRFRPALETDTARHLAAIPTWMAGHAKFVAVYDAPFWRRDGLSGDAMSRRGPLAEIHDASGPDGAPAALFGFLGVPAPQRRGREDDLRAAALQQLARIFGPEAAAPVTTDFADWAIQPETATEADAAAPAGHPAYGLPAALVGTWEGRLHFASTETASDMGGLMEGALASADRVLGLVLGARRNRPAR
ncbi:flavin monoamine oxidase family protein [Palleronia sp. KMU-117]|uniref:flavin monoamine oxidase family protein n=1 Tax=Palleronia sp. KMU-117 TaxID=3434108 RepID=UPI003D744DC2